MWNWKNQFISIFQCFTDFCFLESLINLPLVLEPRQLYEKGSLLEKIFQPIMGMTLTRPKNQTVPRFDATWRVFNWATYGRSSKKEKKKKMTQTLRPPTDLRSSKVSECKQLRSSMIFFYFSCMFLNPNMYFFPIWIIIVLIY